MVSALDAVHCELDILDALEQEADLDLHVGIHVGDVVELGKTQRQLGNEARRGSRPGLGSLVSRRCSWVRE